MEITDSDASSPSPLVVTVLCAHLTLTVATRRAITMQASAFDSRSTRSIVS